MASLKCSWQAERMDNAKLIWKHGRLHVEGVAREGEYLWLARKSRNTGSKESEVDGSSVDGKGCVLAAGTSNFPPLGNPLQEFPKGIVNILDRYW